MSDHQSTIAGCSFDLNDRISNCSASPEPRRRTPNEFFNSLLTLVFWRYIYGKHY